MSGRIYRSILRPLLFRLDPEIAHDLAMKTLCSFSRSAIALKFLRRYQPPPNPITLFGLTFPNRVGLAAGFDKNGVALPAWGALGFGFIEIGTVTARPQPGNPKPRIFRLSHQEALINRLGFNNDGADLVAIRLREWKESGRWPQVPVGINIGKSRTVDVREATADYLQSFRRLQAFADYVVLNVSSPNTPGLRSLQEIESLSELLSAIVDENRLNRPILVKVAPDLADSDLDDVIAACVQHGAEGIIATNTTIDHAAVPESQDETGGLSGAPLRDKSTAIVRAISNKCRLPVIGCGGIIDGASAREKIAAGAELVQIYTGLIYRGPSLLKEVSAAITAAG